MQAPTIAGVLDRFVAGFNDNDLDAVMAFFADDAIYCPGDGNEHRGRAAIRAAFAPQFDGAFGRMRFDLSDRIVDEPARKATIRWVCRHDIGGAHAARVPLPRRWLVRLGVGARFGWHGVDVLHFDAAGRIVGKFTYANYDRPQLRRELGDAS